MEDKKPLRKEKKTIQNLLIISNILLWLLMLKYIFFPLPCRDMSKETSPVVAETTEITVDSTVVETPLENHQKPRVIKEIEPTKPKESASEEDLLWQTAQDKKTLYSYNRYLKSHPQGKHKAEAEQAVIDIEVNDLINKEHGKLPALDAEIPKGGVNPKTSLVKIKNDTEYELIVRYSGPESKRFSIPVGQEISFTTANGNYIVTATTVNGGSIKTYGGTEQLAGKNYFSEFYIKSKS